MQFSVFDAADGRIQMAMEVPTANDAIGNLQPGQLLVEGLYDGDLWYVAEGGIPTPRPVIPAPVQDDHLLSWADPPAGLSARVYDLWIVPPHLLIETPLSAPDCGLHLISGGTTYRIELSAAFPWRDLVMEVTI